MKKTTVVTLTIALVFALTACDNSKNDPAAEPQYRTDTITFAFLDFAGENPAEGTYKATVQGTMLLADYTCRAPDTGVSHHVPRWQDDFFIVSLLLTNEKLAMNKVDVRNLSIILAPLHYISTLKYLITNS